MHYDFWVRTGYRIDLAIRHFFLKKRPFPDTHADLHLVAAYVVKCFWGFAAFFVNHHVKLYIANSSCCLVCVIPILLLLFDLFVLFPAFFAILLNFLNVCEWVADHCRLRA
jgi:hypothetical protein